MSNRDFCRTMARIGTVPPEQTANEIAEHRRRAEREKLQQLTTLRDAVEDADYRMAEARFRELLAASDRAAEFADRAAERHRAFQERLGLSRRDLH